MNLNSDDMSQPLLSIIIPTYNRPNSLAHCLQAFTQLNYPRDRFEVIVVDDGSEMSMQPIVDPFEDDLHLRLIQQVNSGPAAARNQGAAKARGQYLVFTDDDCCPGPDWLTALAQQFAVLPNALLGGQTLNELANNPFSVASQMLVDYLYRYYNAKPHKARFFTSNNMALPTHLFQALGGFDAAFPRAAGEDRDLCDRWLEQGYPMQYVPKARISHAHALNLGSFWRQHFNYGQGAFSFHQRRAQRGGMPIQVEPFAFYRQLLTYPLIFAPLKLGILISILLLISQVANIVGFFMLSFGDKLRFQSRV